MQCTRRNADRPAENRGLAVCLALAILESALDTPVRNVAHLNKNVRLCVADSTASVVRPFLIRLLKKSAPNLTLHIMPILSEDPRPALSPQNMVEQHSLSAVRCRLHELDLFKRPRYVLTTDREGARETSNSSLSQVCPSVAPC